MKPHAVEKMKPIQQYKFLVKEPRKKIWLHLLKGGKENKFKVKESRRRLV